MKNYTWTATEILRHLGSDGNVKSVNSSRWETVILYGQPVRRVLEKNGQPLDAAERRKQQEKFDKQTAKLEKESPAELARRQAKEDKERADERKFLREIPDIYNFRIVRQDQVDGHDAWVISATPKPDYKPKNSDAKPLLKIKGEIWIDKAEYQWVKLDAETIDTISFGWFLARLSAGSKLEFEQARVNGQIWLPKREYVRATARLGLIKKFAIEQELTWSDFHKFQADSKVVATQ